MEEYINLAIFDRENRALIYYFEKHNIMKFRKLTWWSFPFFSLLQPFTAISANKQPNILFFMVDDMGWQDTSVPFAEERTPFNNLYETPNMERLARMGMKFTNAYAASVSSPSRCSLMTGANVLQHKVSNWTLNYEVPTDGANKIFDFEWNWNGICPSDGTVQDYPHMFYAKMLPQILKENGYQTYILGKAHFASRTTTAADPLACGFDVNVGGHAAGAMGSYLGRRGYGSDRKDADVWGVPMPNMDYYESKDIFLTEALTLEAKKLIDKVLESEKPFFMYLSHYAVHTPFEKDMRYYDKYIKKGLSDREAQYASLLEGMDKSLGDMMDLFEEKGIAENTIIIFMSDNGGYSSSYREPDRNAPLRSGKGSLYEGGIREPMIIYWPGVTQPNSINRSNVIIEDFFPTLLEMAQIKHYSVPQHVDGISMVNLLKSEKAKKNRRLYFHYPNDWGERADDAGRPSSAIIKGDWKLIFDYETRRIELYNLADDIGERHDLSEEPRYRNIKEKLVKDLSDQLRATKANMPVYKRTGMSCGYPDE